MHRAADLLQNLTNLFVGIVTAFLGLRFIFRLFNANTANDFVEWLYRVSDQLLEPFRGIFPATELEPGYVIEFSTLFAMVAYALIGFLVLALVDALRPAPAVEERTVKKKARK